MPVLFSCFKKGLIKTYWFAGGRDLVQKEDKQGKDFARNVKDHAEKLLRRRVRQISDRLAQQAGLHKCLDAFVIKPVVKNQYFVKLR